MAAGLVAHLLCFLVGTEGLVLWLAEEGVTAVVVSLQVELELACRLVEEVVAAVVVSLQVGLELVCRPVEEGGRPWEVEVEEAASLLVAVLELVCKLAEELAEP